MEGPSLKLTIEKGPRENQTLEFNPRSTVRIGRVVRGNTFSIKDPGISSNHLTIHFSVHKWVVTDLDSSNGTFVNDTQLLPLAASNLCDGDTIKIGESTSILVKIVNALDGDGEPPLPRKNPRRRAAAASKEHLSGIVVPENRGRRVGTTASSKEENVGAADNGFSGLDGEDGNLGLGVGEDSKNAAVVVPKRRGRPPKKDVVLKYEQEEVACETQRVEVVNVGPVEEKQGQQRMSTRRTRTSKNQQIEQVPESSNFNQDIGKELGVLVPPAGRKARAGTRRRKNIKEEPLEEVQIEELGDRENNKENVGRETCKELASTSGLKDSNSGLEDLPVPASVPDLEKMTLGEWFDYLEEALPRQIRDETEKMIEAMKQRAEQVSEYMATKKNEKDKLPKA